MSDELVSLDELSEDERDQNRAAAETMVVDRWYRFASEVSTVPIERRMRGTHKCGIPITFTRGRYMRFLQRTEEHVFTVRIGEEVFLAPLFLCGGVPCEVDADQRDGTTSIEARPR